MSQPIAIAPGRAAHPPLTTVALSGLALLATLWVGSLGLGAAPASAQTLRMGGGSPSPGGSAGPAGHHRPHFRSAPPKVVSTPPNVVHQPRFFYSGPFNHRRHFDHSGHFNHGRPFNHGGHFNHVPHAPTLFPWSPPALAVPYLASPTYGQWVPGYWAYTWVPQGQATSVWVPGYYDKDGVWVAGYHAAQVVQSGYYQPYWVSGYWVP